MSSFRRDKNTFRLPLFLLVFAAFALMLGAVGCAKDDLYASCQLSGTAQNVAQATCASDQISACVVTQFLDCETRACGKYENSETFCTQECKQDKDCPKGKCIPFLVGSSKKYCISNDELAKVNPQ